MRRKSSGAFLLSLTLALTPAQRTHADDRAAGFLLGALILGAIAAGQQGQAQPPRRSTGLLNAQREQNRQVQEALNYFGWNVGAVDGVVGNNTRAGIRAYERAMGFNPDGQLDDQERVFLLESRRRAEDVRGIPAYDQVFARQGAIGLMQMFRQEQARPATPPTPPGGSPAPNVPGLPVLPTPVFQRSLTQHCNSVAALTASNGGPTTAATMTDPNLALDEQFCLARTVATSAANRMIQAIPNLRVETLEQACTDVRETLRPHIADLGSLPPARLLSDLEGALARYDRSRADLVTMGTVCLGMGYQMDDSEIALASAAILAVSDTPAYGELVGHHLRRGFGIAANAPLGAQWVSDAVAYLDSGGTPAVSQSSTADRVAVLRAALNARPAPSPSGGGLPVFPTAPGN